MFGIIVAVPQRNCIRSSNSQFQLQLHSSQTKLEASSDSSLNWLFGIISDFYGSVSLSLGHLTAFITFSLAFDLKLKFVGDSSAILAIIHQEIPFFFWPCLVSYIVSNEGGIRWMSLSHSVD